MGYQITGIVILMIYYSIYFGKMLLQRKKGIQTNQMAKGDKKGKLLRIEQLLNAATMGVVFVELISIIFDFNLLPRLLRNTGVILACIGTILFRISVYTMRDSWRAGVPQNDKTEIVTKGIYSFSRNPAFLGFDCLYFGLLFMFFNIPLLIITCFAVIMLHLQILQEEQFLSKAFGKEYDDYQNHVGRYIGWKK